MQEHRKSRICVVVLGDLGRSPRMQYHTLSLAKNGYEVDVVAYGGSKPLEALASDAAIAIHLISLPPDFSSYMPRLVAYILKAIWLSAVLFFRMLLLPKPTHVLVQNPPSIPTLPIIWFCCLVRRCRFIIDWHNYGFTILSLSLHPQHFLVRLCHWCEAFFGKLADSHLCVTKAMQQDLAKKWNISSSVMHDRPASIFRPLSVDEKHSFFVKFSQNYKVFQHMANQGENEKEATRFTIHTAGKAKMKENRPVLLVSSTSWTEDEDFSILLDALEAYDKAASVGCKLPGIICVVTGKGPMKEYFEHLMIKRALNHIEFLTPWLEAEDYPKLLACADLGVCLHISSSGLDLPMKVVDMFGCKLPVCAVNFKCIGELVRHGENGCVFTSSSQLAEQLQNLLAKFPSTVQLDYFRHNLDMFRAVSWDKQWKRSAERHFQVK